MSRQREELLDKCPKLEAVNDQLKKELEEKKELITTLYKKNQLEKQVKLVILFLLSLFIYVT